MIAGKGPAGTICAMHTGRKTHDQKPGVRIPERGHRLAVVLGILVLHQIEKCREARTAPATGIENAAHRGPIDSADRAAVAVMKNGVQKTGYADLRVARRRSRLEFGLTRAQPNLSRPGPIRRPAASPTFPWTVSVARIPCARLNFYAVRASRA